jgi:hypothetical protein
MEGYETSFNNKTVVMGMLNRQTREVRAKVIPNVKRGKRRLMAVCTVRFPAFMLFV